jgi:hypothetical protein
VNSPNSFPRNFTWFWRIQRESLSTRKIPAMRIDMPRLLNISQQKRFTLFSWFVNLSYISSRSERKKLKVSYEDCIDVADHIVKKGRWFTRDQQQKGKKTAENRNSSTLREYCIWNRLSACDITRHTSRTNYSSALVCVYVCTHFIWGGLQSCISLGFSVL